MSFLDKVRAGLERTKKVLSKIWKRWLSAMTKSTKNF